MATVEVHNRKEPRTYGNWRRPSSAGLFGLGAVGTGLLLVGLLIVIIVMMTQGPLAAAVALLVVAGVLLTLVMRDADGKNVLSRVSTRAGWTFGRARGANVYRSGPTGRTPWGTNQLPGLAAQIRLSEHEDSYNRPFALLRIPSPTGTSYSIVIGTEPSGASLVDSEQVDIWVADWGQWLANLADEASIEAASVTIETAPDSGTRLRREVALNIDADSPPFAREMLREAVETYPSGSSVVRAYVTITFAAALRVGGKRRDEAEMARDLASRIPGLTSALQATGAGAAHPLTAQQLCEVIRVAYDPASASLIDEARAAGEIPELNWIDVGPSAHQANWSSYRHDSGHSVTWSMTGAPRGRVQSAVLSRLLAPHREITRKRVTLLYRPISPARTAALAEADVTNASFRASSNSKPKARDRLALQWAQRSADEEAGGAGMVNFGMLVTATVLTPSDEADAVAAIDSLGPTARIRLRRVFGSQDSAFAAALPLGLVMTKHIQIPAELRNNL